MSGASVNRESVLDDEANYFYRAARNRSYINDDCTYTVTENGDLSDLMFPVERGN